MYKVGSARISENGSVNGQRGDQTGSEVMIQEAYMHRNGWQIIRAKDPNIANALAFIMAVCCNASNVGYSQNERYLIFWTNLDAPTNCDCSSLVAYCVYKAGITNFEIDGFYTGNEVSRLVGTGAFDVLPCNSIGDMCVGDILVDAKGTSHTVIVVEGNPRIAGNYFDEPNPTLQWGSKGAEVRKLQEFFNCFCSCNLRVDGDFGSKTNQAVRDFQAFFGLVVDGIYGRRTHEAVCVVLWANGVQAV